ncbi:WD40 repeat-like protein [Nadsonia fulvescens var. elongata DSM 6958]|uniref:WD40 repeat-like protein n=1 Tax=Nadsonia fulvescens var. elongata DSM 6958 TaxID=857566 RepID=A0A1E3PCT5_9ASCO|nr:WD40 repeat-like protein [Nadsonia fulvescens var. elongata DSM 6958]
MENGDNYNIVFDGNNGNSDNPGPINGTGTSNSGNNGNSSTTDLVSSIASVSTSSLSSLASTSNPITGTSCLSQSKNASAASLSGLQSERLNYQSSVAEACGLALNTRILEFQPAAPQSSKPIDLRSQYNRPLKPAVNAQLRRKIPTAPERVLDAPGIIDDYYLNLLDWSCDNQVAIALEKSVYIWNAESGTVAPLMDCSTQNYISSVKWSGDGAYLSIGLSDGDVQIWDVEEQTKLRSMYGHSARVGVTSWNKHIVSSGCRDGSIWNHDVRIAQHKVSEYVNHTGEVCGLEWRSDGVQLASGGNDNLVNIWDARSAVPKFTKTNHKAAVKAIAWCPWQLNLLSTGGGSYDKHIHFWNSTTGARVNSIDTGSQVTSLKWSTTYKEIVSSHGFPNNQISIWSYPSLTKNVEIVAHDSRVLHSALSPDGQTLATCASDENLKFWKIFENLNKKVGSNVNSSIVSGKDINNKVMMIR